MDNIPQTQLTPKNIIIRRHGTEVSLVIALHNEYDAMEIFDLWGNPKININIQFAGPRDTEEIDGEAC